MSKNIAAAKIGFFGGLIKSQNFEENTIDV